MWAGVTYSCTAYPDLEERRGKRREGGWLSGEAQDGAAIKKQFPFMGMEEWENTRAPGERERVSTRKECLFKPRRGKDSSPICWEDGRVLLSIKELNWMDTPRDESGEAT